ncbi:MAG: hypothetical protein AAFZ11_01875 [Pseudomonadota bacterium]
MSGAETKPSFWGGPGFYIGLIAASVGAVAGLAAAGAIEGPIVIILLLLPTLLLIPLMRSGQKWEGAMGLMSPALRRYNWRMLVASMAYTMGMGIAVAVSNRYEPGPAATFGITLLPTLPTLAMIWVMARYLIEETDEYLRHRASMASLVGLGLILALGSFWGFLETFGLVPNIWAWWVVPVWAIGLGLGNLVLARVEKRRETEAMEDEA